MASSPLQRAPRAGEARCIALVQEHRGHGVSTTAYYLGRALVQEGLRVLLVDLTGRRARLHALLTRQPMKNLGFWVPPHAQPADLAALLAQARQQTAGRVDVLLLDADASLLEHAGGLAAGVDYAIVVTTPTADGQHVADQIAERLGAAPPPHGKVGVVFGRVEPSRAGELPEQTEHRKLPVIGHYPADYLLAAGDEYSLKGGEPSWPHDKYLYALLRLGRIVIRQAGLRRQVPSATPSATPQRDVPATTAKAAIAAVDDPREPSVARPALLAEVAEELGRGAEPQLGT